MYCSYVAHSEMSCNGGKIPPGKKGVIMRKVTLSESCCWNGKFSWARGGDRLGYKRATVGSSSREASSSVENSDRYIAAGGLRWV
ncbi:hypothetical protein FRX31_012868 [Thalictrum thalictroides]|uniref:Uncharacterized protein n=1 Tax=Thalictrum thalictroides TaxID=46969 RepID=A0A7J6WN77_THATH|nr:hypothetical protein FRX31_012868 [Thalictrum thalictroides]